MWVGGEKKNNVISADEYIRGLIWLVKEAVKTRIVLLKCLNEKLLKTIMTIKKLYYIDNFTIYLNIYKRAYIQWRQNLRP